MLTSVVRVLGDMGGRRGSGGPHHPPFQLAFGPAFMKDEIASLQGNAGDFENLRRGKRTKARYLLYRFGNSGQGAH